MITCTCLRQPRARPGRPASWQPARCYRGRSCHRARRAAPLRPRRCGRRGQKVDRTASRPPCIHPSWLAVHGVVIEYGDASRRDPGAALRRPPLRLILIRLPASRATVLRPAQEVKAALEAADLESPRGKCVFQAARHCHLAGAGGGRAEYYVGQDRRKKGRVATAL